MSRNRKALDDYDVYPEVMRRYLMNYGKHFNKKLYRFAVSQMRDRNGEKLKPVEIEGFRKKLEDNGITLENDVMYDGVYVYSMAMSDFMGSSIEDEKHLLLYVKDLVDDGDQQDGFLFGRFYSDCVNGGVPIEWDDMV